MRDSQARDGDGPSATDPTGLDRFRGQLTAIEQGLAELVPRDVPTLLGDLERLRAVLWARLTVTSTSVILGDAVEDGLLSVNPVSQLARRRRRRDGTVAQADHQKNIRPLSPEQLGAALVAAGQHERRIYPYILTLARAGLRPSEGLAVQWDDLDFAGREIRVERALDAQGRVAPTKTGSARVVDMSVQLAVALQRLRNERAAETLRRGWLERPPWVFCSEVGTPLDLSNVTKARRRVLKKAKLPAFRLYDLRHTFATTLLEEGAPLTYVAAQMGHTKPTTTLLWYVHWIPRGDKRWVDALDRAGSREVGSQMVANSTEVDVRVVEVMERLEPTIGLEPMTCRLRSEGRARRGPASAGNYLNRLT
jgi:integrase